MTDTNLLTRWIDESGYKRSFLAKQLGLSTYGFQLKVEGRNEFKQSEINTLCKLLRITALRDKEKAFFASEVAKTAT